MSLMPLSLVFRMDCGNTKSPVETSGAVSAGTPSVYTRGGKNIKVYSKPAGPDHIQRDLQTRLDFDGNLF